MNDLINFIVQGQESFTPSVMVGIIVFVLILDGLFGLVGAVLKGVRR